MLNLLLVEDNANLRAALKIGLETTGNLRVVYDCDSGETALAFCLNQPPTPDEIARFDSPHTMCVPLDAARWVVPPWSERGLIGVLTLGEKSDGGVYSQEEIEIARASGERLIDTRASAELARRLMALKRQRVAETQLLDQRARRVLHDDVLPQLRAAILAPSRPNPQPPFLIGKGENPSPLRRGVGERSVPTLSTC